MKSALYRSMAAAGKYIRVGPRPDAANSLRVLMYHKVTAARPNSIAVRPEAFAEQQAYLHERYNVISLEELEAHVTTGTNLPPRAVLITFDDGYRDNFTAAQATLERYGHKAVMFVPTSFIGSKMPLPHDRWLKTSNPTASWAELREASDVFEIGSHGCSHRALTSLTFEEASNEIRESKHLLEDRLSIRVRAFSYPKGSSGDFNHALETAIAAAGYAFAFTTIARVNRSPLHRLRIKRHNVEDYGLPYFERLLDGSADVLSVKDSWVGYRLKQAVNRARGRLS